VVIERIFDLGFLALFLLITLPFAVGASWAGTAAIVAGALVVIGFAVLYAMAYNPGWVQGVYGWFSSRWPKVKTFGEEKIDLFLRGLAVLRDPKRFLLVLFWIGVTWGLTLLWNSIILVVFYPQPTVLEAAFVVAVAAVGVAAPSTPGNLGVYEAAIWSAFLALNADPEKGLAFGLATHGMYIALVMVLGAVGLLRTGISLKEIYTLSKDRQT
jgi:uncharacterized protein (TIRG00374 family)